MQAFQGQEAKMGGQNPQGTADADVAQWRSLEAGWCVQYAARDSHCILSLLSGGLQWGARQTFRRLGRAMLRPIFQQIRRESPDLTLELELALKWWLQVLELELCETQKWQANDASPCCMFCDARSTPPRAAAVLFWQVLGSTVLPHAHVCTCCFGSGNKRVFCDEEPPAELMRLFKRRRDNQIMSLELLSIAYGTLFAKCGTRWCTLFLTGISTFADILEGRDVVIFSDNTGAEAAMARVYAFCVQASRGLFGVMSVAFCRHC